MNNKKFKQLLREAVISFLIFALCVCCIIALAVSMFFHGQTVHAETMDAYETQIVENDTQIQNIEKVKNQLHITAELLRENYLINNGFDSLLSQKWFECSTYQESLRTQNEEILNKIEELKDIRDKRKFVGYFKITHYCPCSKCNGSYGNKTALGTKLTPYKTIAVDPKVIPLGSKVEINEQIYIAEDTGGAIKGNRIDLCVASHSEAYAKGVLKNVPVYVLTD